MADDQTMRDVLKEVQAQLRDIAAEQANVGAMIMIHATLLDYVRNELKQIRNKVDNLARTKATAQGINSINAELDRLEQYFADRRASTARRANTGLPARRGRT
jgi:cob(I)alamin adenosyltransferase